MRWTRQQDAETRRRRQAYEQRGVRALWLLKQGDYPLGQEIPAFRLVRDEDRKAFAVWVWSKATRLGKVSEPEQVVELREFIAGALNYVDTPRS